MATTKVYVTSGFPPKDTEDGTDDGSTKIYVTSGFIPDDIEAAGGGDLVMNNIIEFYKLTQRETL